MLLAPYVPSIRPPAPPNSSYVGSGSPEGVVVASPPRIYLDDDTDELYVKATGDSTDTGWVLVSSSGGGGITTTFTGSGSPEGVVTAPAGRAYYWDSVGKVFYVKDSGSGNTGWRELIG